MEKPEKKCAFCGVPLEDVPEDETGEFRCPRCGVTARFSGADLVAIFIPGYYRRLMELEALNKELVVEIEIEGMKGGGRDMPFLRKKHLERQDLLAEFSFLTHFREFVDKW